MCEIKKGVTVEDLKNHLRYIAEQITKTTETITGTVVTDEQYASVTAIIGRQVVCINFMDAGKEE